MAVKKTYFLVHSVSYAYVKHIADYIWLQISKHSSNPSEFLICDDVGTVDIDQNSTVFIIGDPFKIFDRKQGVKYIFLNFSVVAILGSVFSISPTAYRRISTKRRILESKLICFDYILDYWPPQTAALKDQFAKFHILVDSFAVGIIPFDEENLVPLPKRKYDVCFVGDITPRRQRILKKLEKFGVKLSPTEGMPLEEAALESRIVLNLRAWKSNHLETPRILGAYSTGSAVVTEECYQMDDIFPSGTYFSFKYSHLAVKINELLRDIKNIESVAYSGYQWLKCDYSVRCDVRWAEIVNRMEKFSLLSG